MFRQNRNWGRFQIVFGLVLFLLILWLVTILQPVNRTSAGPFKSSTMVEKSVAGIITPTSTITPTVTLTESNYIPIVLSELLPSPTPTATATATPTATPDPTCWQGIVNSSFENNDGWEISNTAYPAGYSTSHAHSGSRSMRVGIENPAENRYSYSSTTQSITIPTGTVDATLDVWLYSISTGVRQSVTLTPPDFIPLSIEHGPLNTDAQYIVFYDQYNQQHNLLYQRFNTQTWTKYSFDMSAFAGQTIKAFFGTYNNGWGGVTSMFVDDVTLTSCAVNP